MMGRCTPGVAGEQARAGLRDAAHAGHERAVDTLTRDFRAAAGPVQLGKTTSNLFRFPARGAAHRLDVGGLAGVLHIDPVAGTAEVGGMCTYERLVDATLACGLMPCVVPQLKTITLGGAIAGLGIESSSFRQGLVHESVLEMEILTGDGRLVIARPDGDHSALFHGFPNSYGTLGYLLRARIQLAPVRPGVLLRHLRCAGAAALSAAVATVLDTGRYAGLPVDFVDGTVFTANESYLTLGSFTDSVAGASDYTGRGIYYRSLRRRGSDLLTVRDYLWRWDTDWFWCSQALGAEHPLLRALWPKRYRRSDVYRRIVGLDRRYQLSDTARAWRGAPAREPVVQDIQVPLERLGAFLDFFHARVGITPIWVCPVRSRHPVRWPLYPLDPATRYVNLGFWSSVALAPDAPAGATNRRIEQEVVALDGLKSLYSTAQFDPEQFWRLYNGPAYAELKQTYDPGARLADLYAKCVRGA